MSLKVLGCLLDKTSNWLELKPRIPEPMLVTPGEVPSRPPVEEVGPPTVMLPLPMEPKELLVVVVITTCWFGMFVMVLQLCFGWNVFETVLVWTEVLWESKRGLKYLRICGLGPKRKNKTHSNGQKTSRLRKHLLQCTTGKFNDLMTVFLLYICNEYFQSQFIY